MPPLSLQQSQGRRILYHQGPTTADPRLRILLSPQLHREPSTTVAHHQYECSPIVAASLRRQPLSLLMPDQLSMLRQHHLLCQYRASTRSRQTHQAWLRRTWIRIAPARVTHHHRLQRCLQARQTFLIPSSAPMWETTSVRVVHNLMSDLFARHLKHHQMAMSLLSNVQGCTRPIPIMDRRAACLRWRWMAATRVSQ